MYVPECVVLLRYVTRSEGRHDSLTYRAVVRGLVCEGKQPWLLLRGAQLCKGTQFNRADACFRQMCVCVCVCLCVLLRGLSGVYNATTHVSKQRDRVEHKQLLVRDFCKYMCVYVYGCSSGHRAFETHQCMGCACCMRGRRVCVCVCVCVCAFCKVINQAGIEHKAHSMHTPHLVSWVVYHTILGKLKLATRHQGPVHGTHTHTHMRTVQTQRPSSTSRMSAHGMPGAFPRPLRLMCVCVCVCHISYRVRSGSVMTNTGAPSILIVYTGPSSSAHLVSLRAEPSSHVTTGWSLCSATCGDFV